MLTRFLFPIYPHAHVWVYHLWPLPPSLHLRARKVHLGMLFLELLQNIQFFLLITGGLPCLLLPLVKHHFLDHTAGLAVEVSELAVLGRDLGGVDFWGGGDDVGPPFELVGFVEVDGDFFVGGACAGERPGGIVDLDGVGERALGGGGSVGGERCLGGNAYIDEGFLALYARLERVAAYLDVQVFALVLGINGDGDVEVLDSLLPLVRQRSLLFLLFCASLGVGLALFLWRW